MRTSDIAPPSYDEIAMKAAVCTRGTGPELAEDMLFLVDLVNRGSYKAVIDRLFTLAQIAEAHAYVETGRKRGSVVVTIA